MTKRGAVPVRRRRVRLWHKVSFALLACTLAVVVAAGLAFHVTRQTNHNGAVPQSLSDGARPVGYLSLDREPVTAAFVGDRPLGQTPLVRVPLPVGRHLVVLKNEAHDTVGTYGVTIEAARQDLLRIHKNMVETREVNEITSPRVATVPDRFFGDSRIVTRVLLGAVGLLLLLHRRRKGSSS